MKEFDSMHGRWVLKMDEEWERKSLMEVLGREFYYCSQGV
jgi:hypothetical protein